MSGEVWTQLYDRLAQLVSEHRTTLVFVNTRRQAERLARHLAERLGEAQVTAHHGSMARESRLDAEARHNYLVGIDAVAFEDVTPVVVRDGSAESARIELHVEVGAVQQQVGAV